MLARLRLAQEELQLRGPSNPLARAIEEVVEAAHLNDGNLGGLLDEPTERLRDGYAEALLETNSALRGAFVELASRLGGYISERTIDAADDCEGALDLRTGTEGARGLAATAEAVIGYYYGSFERYDMISYPILYATEVGEETRQVGVVRISPEDAPSLIDELGENETRRKLTGTHLRNFGAFLDHRWRRNDILWGRLDGAERIITILLPGEEHKPQWLALIREAQRAILAEELGRPDRERLLRLLGTAPALPSATHRDGTLLSPDDLLEFLRTSYRPTKELSTKRMLDASFRSLRVLTGMLRGMTAAHRVTARRLSVALRAQIGRVFRI